VQALAAAAAAATLPDSLAALGRSLHRGLGKVQQLRTLDPHQNATVVAISDLILPATDTPGASAARINEFADLLLTEWVDPADRDSFLAGLADVDARAKAAFGKDFVSGTPAEQTALLTALDDETARWKDLPQPKRGPEPFYHRMKWLTLFGYYSSEVGAVQDQHFVMIPARYVPCAPADSLAQTE